jgi:hypothetical protein
MLLTGRKMFIDKIETDRLIIRPHIEEDFEDV